MDPRSPATITCKGVVTWQKGEALKVEEIEVDPPKCSEVRMKMFSSLCHTDILSHNGFPIPLFPRVLGHEGVGTIESVGENVRDLKEGDLVITVYLAECKECLNCKLGKSNLCFKYPLPLSCLMADGTSRISIRGQTLYHTFSCATWSEYAVCDANYVVKIDPRLPLPHASLLSCGFTSGFGAPSKIAAIEKGSSVVVFGLGTVGLGVVAGAKEQGAAKIIGIDINDFKREKGEAFGMTDFINPNKSEKTVSELIKDVTEGLGADYAFECTGVAALLNEAIDATKMGSGTVVTIGAGGEEIWKINVASILLCGRTFKGSVFGGVRVKSDLPSIVDKCIRKEVQLEELITHEISLEETPTAFELLKQPDCVKVVIKF
ncbi:PREDICTED: alcohol dehydrogenase-like 2 isoform X2 [Ipomoea nil]|uniref:alcohol dehydrogenase-like 2 isoform X2 n=1 Tax=Ipomoea nil TaxID=35883 RepID=UPI0009012EE8|nr:PREDICTED: alcohol dehydrogenase-like 2 isoform X2 [Ipomoea nil]